MSTKLFDDGSSAEEVDDVDFKTNKEYAKSYNKYRQKELLKHLKDKEQNGSGSSSESDSSEDDEDAYNPKFDEEFYKTLSSLKRKDPTIYEKDTKFFENVDIDTHVEKDGESKPTKTLTVKEYEHKMLMETGGLSDADDDTANNRPASPSYNEEQKQIKHEFKQVLDDHESDDEGGFSGLFMKREKTKQEQEQDDAEHTKWLEEHAASKEKSINEIWTGGKLSKDDKFLRDYILSNGYADRDDDEIPTYDEIVADDEFEDKQTEFEHKYNFRFEDPDQEFIKRYPRTIDSSVRKVDTRRKEKRVERRERKDLEKKEKFQEIEMLKELKRNEIEERLEQLKAVTGADELNIDDIDLDGDFDPDEYDKKMSNIFNNDYYQIDEGDEKPEAPSDIEDLQVENYDEYDAEKEQQNNGGHCEDGDFNMDCDYDEKAAGKNFQREMIESTQSRRKRKKRKSKFMEMLETKKPTFDPEDNKTYSDYLDEYYKLECEDIVGDVKCRFKYVETVPCDYGLNIEEILMAKNKELNAWASLKKATQIRPDHVERNEQSIFQKKSRNEMLKRKILCSLYEPSDDEEAEVQHVTKSTTESNAPKRKQSADDKSESAQVSKKKKKAENKVAEPEKNAPSSNVKINEHTTKKADTMETKADKPAKVGKTVKTQGAATSPVPEAKTSKTSESAVSATVTKTEEVKPPKRTVKVKMAAVGRFDAKHETNKLKKVMHKKITREPKNKSNAITDERLRAFGINPKKFQKQQKYGPGSSNNTSNTNSSQKGSKPNQNAKNKNLKLKLAKALKL